MSRCADTGARTPIGVSGNSITLLNIRTPDEITVLHTRITHVNLDSLLAYDIGQPELWNKLATLNVKNRNTYRVGPTKRKLALIGQEELKEAMNLDGGDIFDDHNEDSCGDEENK